MKIHSLKVFYYAVKIGSLTKAAEYLNMSQPSVSRTVSLLEHMFKKNLLIRSPKGVALTREGEIIFDTVKNIITNLEALNDFLVEETSIPKGNLKLATTKALASMWLPYYLRPFLEQNPDLTLSIVANDQELDLGIREADVAIRPYMPHHPDYIQRYLLTFNLRLYASPEYIKKFGMPEKIEDLDHHHLLAFGMDPVSPYGNMNWLLEVGEREEPREPYITLNLGHGLYKLALEGLGIMALSKEYPPLRKSNLINILPDVHGPSVDIFYVYHKSQAKSRRVTALADYFENVLSNDDKNKLTYKEGNTNVPLLKAKSSNSNHNR